MRVVYNSFDGRFSDSPRALHEALLAEPPPAGGRWEHVWLAGEAHRATFPAGVDLAPADGPGAVAALEAADLVVSNTHLQPAWRKRPGARYLQTWHGTPLKRVAADELARSGGGRPAPVPGADDIARWDALLSPGPESTARFRGAFRYGGEVAETGYPRNDALLAPGRDRVRERVRRGLGVDARTTAVLYAPTWRDDVLDERGRRDVDLRLDLGAFAARLVPGCVLLLRLHPMVSDRLGPVDAPGVVDVSGVPDARELHLAADVMVTDYSSAMVDFAVTGKPLLLFAYDYERYRDDVRGLYVDLEAEGPGPLLRTSDAVLDALADLDGVAAASARRLRAFRERFCPLDDGAATGRVLERFVRSGWAAPGGSSRAVLAGAGAQ